MSRHRPWRGVLAVALLTGLPTAAYFAVPAGAVAAQGAPASELAGFNTSATSAAAQFQLLLPGIVPLGDPTLGNFIQASAPYANSTATTGPSTGSLGAPVWPGDAVATTGNAIQTFSPNVPEALVKLLDDPVVARSSYPAQVGSGRTGSLTPAGPAGIGTATTTSSARSSTATASVTDFAPLGSSKGASLIDIASATSTTTATVDAASVGNSAETRIGRISIAGVITIDGINTTASATSDGHHGRPTTTTDIGAVTVAGLAASIGPNGITLNGKGQGGSAALVNDANRLLVALQQIGVSIRSVAGDTEVDGTGATATSGGVLITFQDDNIPNFGSILPQLPIPSPNSLGITVGLGLSQAKAAATLLPGLTVPPVIATTPPAVGPIGASTVPPPCTDCALPPSGVTTVPPSGGAPVVALPQDETALGLPVRTSWVVIALLLAVLAAGPLLTYANWQLLRGRTP